MPRVFTSTIERWQGTVTLCEPLDIEQVMLIEDALDALAEVHAQKKGSIYLSQLPSGGADLQWTSREDHIFIPVIERCVQKWDLQNFTPSPFQATPRSDSHILVRLLWNELLKIYQGEKEVPNE
jgi:hypothetical protein